MKIGIIARNVNKGGSGRYIDKLVSEMSKIKNKKLEIYLFTNSQHYKPKKNLKVIRSNIMNKVIYDLFYLPLKIKRYNLDCVIYPKQIIPITHRILNIKKIVIIHDLIYFNKEFKNEWTWKDNLHMELFMNQTLKNADRIVCVSNFTKESIKNIFNIEENKIIVVHESVDKRVFKKIKKNYALKLIKKYNLKKPFIFYCGSLSKRKNLDRILEAFGKIIDKYDCDLVISSWLIKNNRILKNKNFQKLKDRIKVLGFVKEKELVALYNLAEMYLYPSLYEGFGLPILEAQACRCPVITSNISSMPEVAGKGAILVDPYNVDEIAKAMEKVINDKKIRSKLIKEGYKNIKRFSWEKCAKSIYKCCKDLVYGK